MPEKEEKLQFGVIALAIKGDVDAMNLILNYFEPYMTKLAQKTLFDESGNPQIHIESDIKKKLETKLIISVLKFNLKPS